MSKRIQSVAHVSREFGDLISAGGVKDFTRGLCVAAAEHEIDTHLFLPYPADEQRLAALEPLGSPTFFDVRMDYSQKCRRAEHVAIRTFCDPQRPHLRLHLVDSHRFRFLSDSDGDIPRHGVYTYTSAEAQMLGRPDLAGNAYDDFFELNVLLVKSALRAIELLQIQPDVIHCHDGHVGFLPLIAQCSTEGFAVSLSDIPTLVTIHTPTNHYRGEVRYDSTIPWLCGVPYYIIENCLHNGHFDPMLIGGLFATGISTVSENFARELQTTGMDWRSEWLGHRLAGYGVTISGITNGIDPRDFDPSDPERAGLPAGFDPPRDDFVGKRICKRMLLRETGLDRFGDDTPLLTFVGRFSYNKGYDVLSRAITSLFSEDPDIVLIGNGNGFPPIAAIVRSLHNRFSDRVFVDYDYNPQLGNRIFAGGDFCLVPSLYESCGTVDYIAQLFGNVPIVHAVGGLVKVVDGVNGFAYVGAEEALLAKLKEAIGIYRTDRPRLRRLQRTAVETIHERYTWFEVFGRKYLPLYQQLVERSRPKLPD